MKLKIVFKYKFEKRMKKKLGSFENPQVFHGVEFVYLAGGYLHCMISDTVRWRMKDIYKFYCDEGD